MNPYFEFLKERLLIDFYYSTLTDTREKQVINVDDVYLVVYYH